jgi:hypothetical protein
LLRQQQHYRRQVLIAGHGKLVGLTAAIPAGTLLNGFGCIAAVCYLLYRWAYNANSGDTGGLVENDWQTFNWLKLRWLQDNLNLKPWYMV